MTAESMTLAEEAELLADTSSADPDAGSESAEVSQDPEYVPEHFEDVEGPAGSAEEVA